MTNSITSYTPAEIRAAKMEKLRRQSSNDLTTFKRVLYKRYKHAPHLDLLDDLLMQVSRYAETGGATGLGRVIVEMPPRHSKTLTTSRFFPVWHLGRNPDHRVMLVSYGASLAHKNSRYARNIIRLDRYRWIFPDVELSQDSQAVDAWEIAGHEGGADALGVGGAATGKGAHILICDDLVKNYEEAHSEVIREKTWDSFITDLYTRLEPGGAIVLMATRWHLDDPIGRALEVMPDENWHRLRLPAMAEENDPLGRKPGEALWSDRYPLHVLEKTQKTLGSYMWSAVYQQNPVIPEGNRFKRGWFEFIHVLPAGCSFARYWDKAGTEGGGAYTAGVLMARHPNGLFFVVDVVRGQWGAMEREAMIKQTAELDRTNYGHVMNYVEKEPGSGGKESAEATIRNLAGFTIRADSPTGDKDVRLYPFEAQSEAGNVKLMAGAWNTAWLDELCAIPNGKYRDQADASAGAFNMLTRNQPLQVSTSRYA